MKIERDKLAMQPVLFSGWVNALIYIVWGIHIAIFGRCALTILEYGKDSKTTFGEELLKRLHINMKKSTITSSPNTSRRRCVLFCLSSGRKRWGLRR